MSELNIEQLQNTNGGVVPFIVGVVAFDLGLTATMWIVGKAMER